MMAATALLVMALAAAAQAQGGVMMTNSPPPVVAVPRSPPAPVIVAPPPPSPVIAAPPQARRPVQSLVSAADYPISALASREEGRVEFRLDVGPDGRVHGCTITRSSGSRALDSVTCMILRRRARYTPARDSNGTPAGAPVDDAVEWRLPGEDGERG